MKHALLITLGVTLAMSAPTLAGAQISPAFVSLLEKYARGERAEAVAELAKWPERELARALDTLRDWAALDATCPESPLLPGCAPAAEYRRLLLLLPAAVMLYSDRDAADRPAWSGGDSPVHCPGKFAAMAANYAKLLARRPDTKNFARRFFLATAWWCQKNFCLSDARRWADSGLELFPRDRELLLAAGSSLEFAGTLTPSYSKTGMADLSMRRRDEFRKRALERGHLFRQARRYLEDAAAVEGPPPVARLRLGRVLWQLGEFEAAQAALEEALKQAGHQRFACLAHLFLGRVHEDAGRLDRAEAEYRLALVAEPNSQAAAVALSQVLRRTGDFEEAQRVLVKSLRLAARVGRGDPYWEYLLMNLGDVEELFAELRRESLQSLQ